MGTKKIGVIMPVTQFDMASNLLKVLDSGRVKPSWFLIFDDSDTQDFEPPKVSFPLEIVITDRTNWAGINAFWREGVSRVPEDIEFVSFLNDDVLVVPELFELVLEVFELNPKAGVVCPSRKEGQKNTSKPVLNGRSVVFGEMAKRDGAAFTFRKEVLNQIPSLPSEFKVYFGDDWFFYWTYRLGYNWVRIGNCVIVHCGSLGAASRGLGKKYLSRERTMFLELIKTMPRVKYPVPHYLEQFL